jgi:aquaporin SIP
MVAAVWAAVFIIRFVPPDYRHMVGGPTLQVDPFKGILVEGILTYMLMLVSLMTMLRGQCNPRAKQLISVVSTVMLIILGGAYTGPSMNPTNVSLILFQPAYLAPFSISSS